ncbi:MAG: T9SS type A sorting domain-containing protein [Candidatus Cloacimonetes bacterium]|nr:T9SS type A sorting domain-containing protein [Candidatus Cloacimonadota bacterium]
MRLFIVILMIFICIGSILGVTQWLNDGISEYIWFTSSSSQDVRQTIRSGIDLYHHSYTDDLLFYGTDRWAVNFIINDMISFPPADSVDVVFFANAISIFMPQSISAVSIALHENVIPQHDIIVTQPGTILFNTTINLIAGWNTIPFETEISITNSWIVLGFPDNITDIGVSASLGGGNHSYFFDRFGPTSGIFRNMRNNGFEADLLFHLVGSFDRPILMIDILDFSVPTFISYNEPFLPSFNIRNNSSISVKDVYVSLSISNSTNNFIRTETVNISSEMPAGQIYSSDMIDFRGIDLPQEFAQYDISIQTGCNNEGHPFLRSSASAITNVFEHKKERSLLEVFTLSSDAFNESLLDFIDTHTESENLDILFYFANSVDPLHTLGAYQRHMQYLHQGFQHTYFNGYLKYSNFSDLDFFTKFNDNYIQSLSDRTFITTHGFDAFLEDEINLVMEYTIMNENTDLLVIRDNDIIFNAAFVQPLTISGRKVKVVTQYITNGIPGFTLNLPKSDSGLKLILSFPVYNINLLSDNSYNDLEVFVWFNRRATKEIYYHDIFSLEDIDFPENINPNISIIPEVFLYPNPIKHTDVLNIDFLNSKEQQNVRISIYNIRGQRIVSRDLYENSLSIDSLNINTSGIYFMRVNWTESGVERSHTRRFMILK